MTAYLVCESERDARLLTHILPKELLETVEIIPAGGLSAVKSLARSLLVRRQAPVAVVIDSDSLEPAQVEVRSKDVQDIIGGVSANTPFKVILAVPTLWAVFFYDVSLLSQMLGYMPSSELLTLATYQPRQALAQLISQSEKYQSEDQLIEQMTKQSAETFWQIPVIKNIIQFFQSVREPVKAT